MIKNINQKINDFEFTAKGGMALGIIVVFAGTIIQTIINFIVMTLTLIQGGSVNQNLYIMYAISMCVFIYILLNTKRIKK